MSYDKTTWQTGDIVTAEKLNKLEDGVQNATELPSVTAEDDGDVLTVVSGAWAKATPSGGGGVEFITETYDDATSTSTLNKTYSEITAMVEDGKFPVIIYEGETSTAIYFVQGYSSNTEDETTTYTVEDNDGRSFTADSANGTLTYGSGVPPWEEDN